MILSAAIATGSVLLPVAAAGWSVLLSVAAAEWSVLLSVGSCKDLSDTKHCNLLVKKYARARD